MRDVKRNFCSSGEGFASQSALDLQAQMVEFMLVLRYTKRNLPGFLSCPR